MGYSHLSFSIKVQRTHSKMAGLVEETGRSASALQRDELKQFHKEYAVNEVGDLHSFNDLPDMMKVMKVVCRTDAVIESERRPDPTLQEDTLSVSSSTSLQDPRDVIAEKPVKPVAVSQMLSSDKDRENELDMQDGDKASAPSNSPPENGDNAKAATKEAAVVSRRLY